jgi:hypothetical protein
MDVDYFMRNTWYNFLLTWFPRMISQIIRYWHFILILAAIVSMYVAIQPEILQVDNKGASAFLVSVSVVSVIVVLISIYSRLKEDPPKYGDKPKSKLERIAMLCFIFPTYGVVGYFFLMGQWWNGIITIMIVGDVATMLIYFLVDDYMHFRRLSYANN